MSIYGSPPYRVEVKVPGQSTWATNALTFDTAEEAKANAQDLLGRWLLPDAARVVSDEVPLGEEFVGEDERIVVDWRK